MILKHQFLTQSSGAGLIRDTIRGLKTKQNFAGLDWCIKVKIPVQQAGLVGKTWGIGLTAEVETHLAIIFVHDGIRIRIFLEGGKTLEQDMETDGGDEKSAIASIVCPKSRVCWRWGEGND